MVTFLRLITRSPGRRPKPSRSPAQNTAPMTTSAIPSTTSQRPTCPTGRTMSLRCPPRNPPRDEAARRGEAGPIVPAATSNPVLFSQGGQKGGRFGGVHPAGERRAAPVPFRSPDLPAKTGVTRRVRPPIYGVDPEDVLLRGLAAAEPAVPAKRVRSRVSGGGGGVSHPRPARRADRGQVDRRGRVHHEHRRDPVASGVHHHRPGERVLRPKGRQAPHA